MRPVAAGSQNWRKKGRVSGCSLFMECRGAIAAQRGPRGRTSLPACFLPLTLDELSSSILCRLIVLVCHG